MPYDDAIKEGFETFWGMLNDDEGLRSGAQAAGLRWPTRWNQSLVEIDKVVAAARQRLDAADSDDQFEFLERVINVLNAYRTNRRRHPLNPHSTMFALNFIHENLDIASNIGHDLRDSRSEPYWGDPPPDFDPLEAPTYRTQSYWPRRN